MKKDNLMQRTLFLLIFLALAGSVLAQPGAYKPISNGTYRLPYGNGTEVRVSGDYIDHFTWRNRYDMVAENSEVATIVAAADGWIETIVDTNTAGSCLGQPGCENNYVWMRHPNGEWTKYSHMAAGSVTGCNRYEGEWVCAGAWLGTESDIGRATGRHLHFEVAVPNDPTDPYNGDGFLYNDNVSTSWGLYNRQNRIPVFCFEGTSNSPRNDEVHVADICYSSQCPTDNSIGSTTQTGLVESHRASEDLWNASTYVMESQSGALFQAGESITLKPGFHAKEGAYFLGHIQSCGWPATGTTGGCLNKTVPIPEIVPSAIISDAEYEVNMTVVPNPSNTRTEFRYILPREEMVTLSLLDLQGKTVKHILYNEYIPTGSHEISVKVSDLPNGVYLYRLVTSGTHLSGKLVVQH